MNIRRLTALTIAVALLTGCATSTPPPAGTKFGLLALASFDPIFMASAPNTPKAVYYKAMAVPYQGQMPSVAVLKDNLVMTDVGVYLAEWDVDRASFIYKLFLSNNKIRTAKVETLERTLMPNSEAIVISTHTETYKFMIVNGSASQAVMILESRIGISK